MIKSGKYVIIIPSILPIFFLSGFAGGIYEVIWAKELVLILGGTAFAVSTVLSSYMAGLAIGSYWIGRYVDRTDRNPVVLFAFLELGIALCGLLILVVPTILMGGTLPVLSKGLVRREGVFGLYVGRLYAVNTLGAMFGALCVGFFLLPAVGVMRSTFTAFAVNCAVAVTAILVYRRFSGSVPAPAGKEPCTGRRGTEGGGKERPGTAVPGSLLLVVAAISGFTSMSHQVVYTEVHWFDIKYLLATQNNLLHGYYMKAHKEISCCY